MARTVQIQPSKTSKRRSRPEPLAQGELPLPSGWSGARKGAGRPKKPGAKLRHAARPEHAERFPVIVSVRTVPARTWLLTVGWRRHGLIGVDEIPRAAFA